MKANFQVDFSKISTQSLSAKVKKAIIAKYYDKIYDRLDDLNSKILDFFYYKFLDSDTYRSLQNGELRKEFGLSDRMVSDLPNIVKDLLQSSVQIDKKSTSKDFVKIRFEIEEDPNNDYLSLGAYSTEKGEVIAWLWWLLTQGTNEVVSNAFFLDKTNAGRSGGGVMVVKDGQSYNVSAEFAGVEGDNWITRTINENKSEFIQLIKKNFYAT